MLSTRRSQHDNLCVLQVDQAVLDLPGVRITDQNAASKYVRFFSSPSGLAYLDRDYIYAQDWRHEDQIEFWRHRSAKCAEVLVPEKVEPAYVTGAHVSGTAGHAVLRAVASTLTLNINPSMFFQE